MNEHNLFQMLVSFTSSVHEVTHELTKDAKPEALSHVQYKMLEYIAISQPVTPSEINDCQNMSMPNTSRELGKLKKSGLIQSIPDEKDRRKHYVCLTSEGESLMNNSFAIIQSHFHERIQHLSKDELKNMQEAMALLQSKLFY